MTLFSFLNLSLDFFFFVYKFILIYLMNERVMIYEKGVLCVHVCMREKRSLGTVILEREVAGDLEFNVEQENYLFGRSKIRSRSG